MADNVHVYGPVVMAIVLSAIIAAGVGMYNRMERLNERIHHKDYLEEKFRNLEKRIEKLETLTHGCTGLRETKGSIQTGCKGASSVVFQDA